MRIIFPLLLIGLLPTVSPFAQSPKDQDKEVRDAFLITRMAEKFHVRPHPLDDSLSARIWSRLLDELDPEKNFLTREDLDKLSPWQLKLDEEIRNTRSGFLSLLTGIYKQRLLQADTTFRRILSTPFDLSAPDKLTAAELNNWPANSKAAQAKIVKLLRLSVLRSVVRYYQESGRTPSRKITDSLEPVYRRTAVARAGRTIKRMLQSPQGFETMIGILYCSTIANSYDPHTDYFPPSEKTAFESELGNKPLAFGFSLRENEDGIPVIARLLPGSPAFQSGALNKGDKFLSVQWDKKDAIDVSGAGLEELNAILSDQSATQATLIVQKSDGSHRQVTLNRARLSITDEEDKVKGYILSGSRNIGYISLPAFYSDWEDSQGINGCANDVARVILRLKKENIQGLILDLRYNGGGSMEEAVELSGIFIDAGPVELIKSRDPKVLTLKDVNRGTIYDGPLVLFVNGYSASASEMVAGTLQDYHRALIVGSPTYGKATAQVVLPMDTTIDIDRYNGNAIASSYIKMTISRLFRITGASAQLSGVIPDITLPDPPGTDQTREANDPAALPSTTIEANKYYLPLPALPIQSLSQEASRWVDSSAWFRKAIRLNAAKNALPKDRDHSLVLADALNKGNEPGTSVTDPGEQTAAAPGTAPLYQVSNLPNEQRRILADPDLRPVNDERKTQLAKDPYIGIAWRLLNVWIK